MYGYYQRYYCNDESIRQQLQVGIDNRIVNGGVGKIVQYLYVYAIDFFEAIIGYLYFRLQQLFLFIMVGLLCRDSYEILQ